MSRKNITGRCKICNKEGKLSYEHIPPQAAFNNKGIFAQNFDHLYNENSYVYGKRMKKNKGFGKYSLCVSCNNLTGDWYARDFSHFCKQGMNQLITERTPNTPVKFNFKIKPLNVFKQIMVMFMANEATEIFQRNEVLRQFILNREENTFPENFNIYLYCSLSTKKKMLGFTMMGHVSGAMLMGAEINFHPFGYLLVIDSDTELSLNMPSIIPFKDHFYNKESTLELELPYLNISLPLLGVY